MCALVLWHCAPPPLISNTILWSPTGGKRILWNSGSESWAGSCAGFNGNHHHQMEEARLDFIVASDAPELGARVTKIKGEVNPFWHAGPCYSSERALFNGICHAMRNMSGFWENWSRHDICYKHHKQCLCKISYRTRNQINDTFLFQNRVKVVGEVLEKWN